MSSLHSTRRPLSAGAFSNFSRRPIYTPQRSWNIQPTSHQQPLQYDEPCLSMQYRKWIPSTKSERSWDGLNKEHDLWFPDGDCLVYLCNKNFPGKRPSFRIPHAALRDASCEHLIDPASLRKHHDKILEVYLPAPKHSSARDMFQWHVNTRNFLAWALGKPIVGIQLSQAILSLLGRMQLLRTAGVNNIQDFLSYAETVGYLDFSNNSEYALAMLHVAETFHIQDLYTDAFAHCVGMYDGLPSSIEFMSISRVTKVLLAQSCVELDRHVDRVTTAVGGFLEEDLSESHVGLGTGARTHLDRFRSFLQSYHIAKFGYWPLLNDTSLCAGPYRIMYNEFRSLYDYLADKDSIDGSSTHLLASGGICALQNIEALNQRHNFVPLPYMLPLLPDTTRNIRRQSQRQPLGIKLVRKPSKAQRDLSVWAALANAANPTDRSTTQCPLVQEYISFEKDSCVSPEEDVTVADARKVRWMLVYGVLQMLGSIMRVPAHVNVDKDLPDYPVCCSITRIPTWSGEAVLPTAAGVVADQPPSPALSIRPDCDGQNYFQHLNEDPVAGDGNRLSTYSNSTPTISRAASFKSLRSLSRRSLTPKRTSSIVVRSSSASALHTSFKDLHKPSNPPSPTGTPPLPNPPPAPPSPQPPSQHPLHAPIPRRNPLRLNPTSRPPSRTREGRRTPLPDDACLARLVGRAPSDSSVDSTQPSPLWSEHSADSDSDYGSADEQPAAPQARRLSLYRKPLDRLLRRSSVYGLMLKRDAGGEAAQETGDA